MCDYAHPEVLVSTEWVSVHGQDEGVRLVEVDADNSAYGEGHAPGAIAWAWKTHLCDVLRRDILQPRAFEALMEESGIGNETAVVLYGDNHNWFAAWAFWEMKIYGHKDVRLMNGGRSRWIAEGRRVSTAVPRPGRSRYRTPVPDVSGRTLLSQIEAARAEGAALIDVRSPLEFGGEILAPPGLPDACQRGGHIPGALNIPWNKACAEDGTFLLHDHLKALYSSEGIDGSRSVITYCRTGEQACHTWFVLRYLLGLPRAAVYDGSWNEWGSLVGVPVEKGAAAAAGGDHAS